MHPYEVLKRPILTEKTDYQSDALHRYTFEVDVRANKHLVRDAVQTVFSVTVQDVHIINVHGKQRRFGRHMGQTSGWKKAIVTLAPGESISFFEGV
jgi:large subunit ribosomal protein L23